MNLTAIIHRIVTVTHDPIARPAKCRSTRKTPWASVGRAVIGPDGKRYVNGLEARKATGMPPWKLYHLIKHGKGWRYED